MKYSNFPHPTRRKCVLGGMAEKTRKAAQEFHTKLRLANLRELIVKHDIGTSLAPICRFPGTFGATAPEQLAEFLGIPGGLKTLLEMAAFARLFPKDFVIEQANTPMADGAFVTYGHFALISRCGWAEERRQLLERVREKCMTVAQLRREIKALRRQV
jgi:hypothetical protein